MNVPFPLHAAGVVSRLVRDGGGGGGNTRPQGEGGGGLGGLGGLVGQEELKEQSDHRLFTWSLETIQAGSNPDGRCPSRCGPQLWLAGCQGLGSRTEAACSCSSWSSPQCLGCPPTRPG